MTLESRLYQSTIVLENSSFDRIGCGCLESLSVEDGNYEFGSPYDVGSIRVFQGMDS